MKSAALVVLCVVVGILAALGTVALLLLSEEPTVTVQVVSNPPRATVFAGSETLGVTPLPLKVAPNRKLSLRLVHKDCKDGELEVNGAAYPAPTIAQRLHLEPRAGSYECAVTLDSTAEAEIAVKAYPAGTEVFLDGQRLGEAPLRAGALTPGSHTLRMAHPECFPITETISLSPGESLVIDRTLEEKMVVFYRERMRKEPYIMVNCAELAHYYILRGQFAEAAQALRDGFPGLTAPTPEGMKWPQGPIVYEDRNYQQMRYFTEMQQFYTGYYERPSGDDAVLRAACKELIQQALDQKIGQPAQIQNYLKAMQQWDKDHPAKK